MSRFVLPYRQGRGIAVGGRPIPVDDIEQIRIGRSEVGSKQLWGVASQRSSTGYSSTEWYVVDISEDVTNQYITGPPGGQVTRDSVPKVGERGAAVDARKIWVVHGRDIVNRDAMFSFLRAINLDPVEWSEARRGTGRPQPYVGEVLDYAFSIAQAVVVILTPDDEARLGEQFRQDHDPPHETELTGQARPNVIFEAGMAMGRAPERTVLVELGRLRPFSDVAGLHIVRFDGSSQMRQDLAQRLEDAGCQVNTDRRDWHTAGEFEIP